MLRSELLINNFYSSIVQYSVRHNGRKTVRMAAGRTGEQEVRIVQAELFSHIGSEDGGRKDWRTGSTDCTGRIV